MRVDVGNDLVFVPELEASVARFGQRFLDRVFTPQELAQCNALQSPAERSKSLAARFAAKEAVMKLLRPRASDALPWRCIEVQRLAGCAPQLVLHGNAAVLARAQGLAQLSLSLSHDHDYASAVVVALHRSSSQGVPA